MQEKDSVAVYFVQSALHSLAEQPQRVAAILAEAGIDPQLLGDNTARVATSAFAKLWLAVARELNDEFLGLDSHGMPQGSFALICRGLIHSATLGQALKLCIGGLGLFIRDIGGSLSVRGKHAVIRLDNHGHASSAAEETYLTIILGLLCWLAGRRIPINRSQFVHPRPPHGDDHLFWGPNLSFEASHSEIELDASYLSLPLMQDHASLKQFLRTSPQWLIVRFSNRQGLGNQVFKALLHCRYEHWPTLADLAREHKISIPSLRRQLQREGFSFQTLKDEARRNIAFECLRNSELSIGEIAERAGFQEASALHRAFKQWTGQSPGQYRRNAKAGSAPDQQQPYTRRRPTESLRP